MAMLIWIHILFFAMVTPAHSSRNKVLEEKAVENYATNKLGFGLGWSLGGLPSFGIGLGGDSTSSPGPTSDGFPGFSFGGGDGGSINSGFNIGAGFDLGGGGGTATGGHGGSTTPNSCHCGCDKAGGTSGKSNDQYPPAPNGAFSHIAPQHY